MNRLSMPVIISAALIAGSAVAAEQFVAKIDAPFQGGSTDLLSALKIVEIDIFEHDGASYIIVEAPDEGYVEAYFFAMRLAPEGLYKLQADWMASGLSGLQLEQRLQFLTPAHCGFCTS